MPDVTNPTNPPVKAARKSQTSDAPTTPRVRRPANPRIVAARKRLTLEISVIHQEDASARQLRVILLKRLPKMVDGDRQKLFEHLAQTQTPPLPLK